MSYIISLDNRYRTGQRIVLDLQKVRYSSFRRAPNAVGIGPVNTLLSEKIAKMSVSKTIYCMRQLDLEFFITTPGSLPRISSFS